MRNQSRQVRVVAVVGLLCTSIVLAQGHDERLASSVARHKSGAGDAELELQIVADLSELSASEPSDWRPDFWAAYILSQVVMSNDEFKAERIAASQEHLTRAMERANQDGSAPLADLHALQSLVHEFAQRSAESKVDFDHFAELANTELQQAYETGKKSPVLMVMTGTDIAKQGQTEKNWPLVMAGDALLARADELFAASKDPIGLTTHFNREWIKPWRDWIERMYEGGFEAE